MKVDRLDHLVLTVKDVNASIRFYTTVLCMEEITFGMGRKALAFGDQKINLHEQDRPIKPCAMHPTPGSADLCFITDTPVSTIAGHLRSCRVEIVEGPAERTGAAGPIRSIYFRDPDGNLIEVSNYK